VHWERMPRGAPREKMIQVGFLGGVFKRAKWLFSGGSRSCPATASKDRYSG